MSRICQLFIDTALFVFTPIGIIAVCSDVAYNHGSKQDQSLPQKDKRFLDNPDSRSEHVGDNKTSKPKQQYEQEYYWEQVYQEQ